MSHYKHKALKDGDRENAIDCFHVLVSHYKWASKREVWALCCLWHALTSPSSGRDRLPLCISLASLLFWVLF